MLRLADVRRVAVCELHREDSETPNVDFSVVAPFALDQLWSHPADCSHLARSCISLLSELSGVAKVSQFDLALLIDKDVVTLDVSVDNVPLVQVLQSEQGLP